MSVTFKISFAGRDELADWLEYVDIADTSGFWGLGVGDSQSIYLDTYVRCTLAAVRTRNLLIGPWVTNPLTRHPAVTASAIVSVDQVSGGRAYLGIGSGDSAVLNADMKPSRMAYLEDYVRVVKDLMARGKAEWEGRRVALSYAKRSVPVYVASSGPKTARLAGRVGDGAICAGVISPEAVRETLEQVRAGALEAGRKLEDIDVWWGVMANLAEDDATALNELKSSLVTRAHHVFRYTTEGMHLPRELVPAMQRIQREYQPLLHGALGTPTHARLADGHGVAEYLARSFSLCGSPETFVRRAREMEAMGVTQISLQVRGTDRRRFLRLWNERVRPQLG